MAELLIHQLVQINKSLQIADANFWLCQMRQKMYAASVPEWELRISELNDCNDSDHFSSSNVCWCWLGIVGWAAQFVLGKFVKHHVYFSIFFVAIPGLFSVNFCSFQSLLQNWNSVDFIGIRTRIVEVESEHLTTWPPPQRPFFFWCCKVFSSNQVTSIFTFSRYLLQIVHN